MNPVEHIGFIASIEEGARILRYLWPALPRDGEDDAWESHQAMCRYVTRYDDEHRHALRPWLPVGYAGPHARVHVGAIDRLVTAEVHADTPWMATWTVDFRPVPAIHEAGLLIAILEHKKILYWLDQVS